MLASAISRFRRLAEATTSAMLGLRTSNTNLPFYGRAALAQFERQRKARSNFRSRCKGYDPECRDAERIQQHGQAG